MLSEITYVNVQIPISICFLTLKFNDLKLFCDTKIERKNTLLQAQNICCDIMPFCDTLKSMIIKAETN